jgi:hypothetical protein
MTCCLRAANQWIWWNMLFQAGLYVILTVGGIISLALQTPEEPRAVVRAVVVIARHCPQNLTYSAWAMQLPDKDAVETARKAAEDRRQMIAASHKVAQAAAASHLTQANTAVNLVCLQQQPEGNMGNGSAGVDINSSLEFTPITLVWKNLWCVAHVLLWPGRTSLAVQGQAAGTARLLQLLAWLTCCCRLLQVHRTQPCILSQGGQGRGGQGGCSRCC